MASARALASLGVAVRARRLRRRGRRRRAAPRRRPARRRTARAERVAVRRRQHRHRPPVGHGDRLRDACGRQRASTATATPAGSCRRWRRRSPSTSPIRRWPTAAPSRCSSRASARSGTYAQLRLLLAPSDPALALLAVGLRQGPAVQRRGAVHRRRRRARGAAGDARPAGRPAPADAVQPQRRHHHAAGDRVERQLARAARHRAAASTASRCATSCSCTTSNC